MTCEHDALTSESFDALVTICVYDSATSDEALTSVASVTFPVFDASASGALASVASMASVADDARARAASHSELLKYSDAFPRQIGHVRFDCDETNKH